MKTFHKAIVLLTIVLMGLGVLGLNRAWAAEMYWIAGNVTRDAGQPVENVELYLDGVLASKTGISGLYIIADAAPGTHRLQPVKEGLVFSPEWMDVSLPPDAPDMNFIALDASSGDDSRMLLPLLVRTVQPIAVMEPEPLAQPPSVTYQGLAAIFRSILLLMALLSIGAFLALTVRRLRSGEWSMAFLLDRGSAQALTNTDEESEDTISAQAETTAAAWLQQGIAQVQNGDLEQGEESLRVTLSQDERCADAWFWLGVLKVRQDQKRTAERCFLQAQRLGHPHAAQALHRLSLNL